MDKCHIKLLLQVWVRAQADAGPGLSYAASMMNGRTPCSGGGARSGQKGGAWPSPVHAQCHTGLRLVNNSISQRADDSCL